MGCVEQAVLEFDEEVRAPWRPLLVSVPALVDPIPTPVLRQPGRASRSRVGACRPSAPGGQPARRELLRPPVHHGASRRSRPRVRLTRRARRLVFVLALVAAVLLGSLVGSLVSGAEGEALHLAGVSSVVVQPGDTLWTIAASVADGNDVRAVVDRIQELNRLAGSDLAPGQVLQLP